MHLSWDATRVVFLSIPFRQWTRIVGRDIGGSYSIPKLETWTIQLHNRVLSGNIVCKFTASRRLNVSKQATISLPVRQLMKMISANGGALTGPAADHAGPCP